MADQKSWFIRVKGKTVGPLNGADVRRFAKTGRLHPGDGVSPDGQKWYRAQKVKGLEFGEPAMGADPETREDETVPPAGRAPAGRRARTAQTDDAAYPLFRVSYISGLSQRGLRLLHAYEILALFPQEIVRARSVFRPSLEEADCTPDGAVAYFQRFRGVKRIPLAEITSAQLRAGLAVDWRFRVRPDGRALLLLRRGRRKIKLRMAAQEAPHVHRRMQQLLGERFQPSVRWRGPEAGLPVLLLGLMVLFIVVACVGAVLALASYSQNPLSSIPGLVAAGLAILVGTVIAAYALRCAWVAIFPPQYPFEALDAPHWPLGGHRPVRVRQPYRSAWLGWSLKIVAAVWLGLVIWLTPRVAAKAREELKPSNSSNDPSSAIFTAACIPTLFLLYIGQGLVQRDVKRELADDQRRPLLYLRSFSVDGTTTLQPDKWLAGYLGVSGVSARMVFGARPSLFQWKFVQLLHPLRLVRLFFGANADTAEQSIVGYFRHVGPIVAIGKPGERISSVGAEREYVGDDEWQEVVMKRLRGSQAVLLQPARSAGMDWELDAVFQHCPLERILIVLTQANHCANQYEELRAKLSSLVHHDLPRSIPFRGRPTFMWFEKDGTPRWAELSYRSPATWLFTGNAIDLEHTLRPFVEGIHGGERELPRPVRKYSWPHSAVAMALAGIWLLGVGLWLNSGNAATATVRPAASGQPSSAPTSVFADRVIKGKTCPYQVSVPSSWQPRVPQNSVVEYEFARPGVGVLKLIAHAGSEDLSTIAEQLVQTEQKDLGTTGTIRAEGVDRVVISGRNCVRGELRCDMRNGTKVIETFVAYSGSDGTVLLDVGCVSTISPADKKEIDDIIGSLRFPALPPARALPPTAAIPPVALAPAAAVPRAPAIHSTPPANKSDSAAERTVRGVAVPYSLSLPASWQQQTMKAEMLEYAFSKPVDGGAGVVRINANKAKEDVSKIPDQLLQGERTTLGDKGSATMKSLERITIDGRAGVKVQIFLQTKAGPTASETAIACSGDDGTVLVVGVVTGSLDQPDGRRELEEILSTLHFASSTRRPDAKR